jgi:hypothetical protein
MAKFLKNRRFSAKIWTFSKDLDLVDFASK